MLGKTEGMRSRGERELRWLDGITDSTNVSLNKLQETVKDRSPGVLRPVHTRAGHSLAADPSSSVPPDSEARLQPRIRTLATEAKDGEPGELYCIIKQQRSVNMVFNTNGK